MNSSISSQHSILSSGTSRLQHGADVSVLIPNLHSPDLGRVLAALRVQTLLPREVIVIGQDRYGFAVEDELVRVIATPHPVPPALVLNAALSYAKGAVCCLLDADCEPTPGWLAALMQRINEGYAVVGGGLGFQEQSYWQRCDNIASWACLMANAPAGLRPHLSSGNMAIRRDVLRQVGSHDERFRMAGGEDTELCFRLRWAGYKLFFEPRAVVYNHSDKDTARTTWQHLYRHGTQWHAAAASHQAILPVSYWQHIATRWPAIGVALTPLVALRDICEIYGAQQGLLRQQPETLPGVFWARTGWYIGRVATIVQQPEGWGRR
ncbi:MAG: glycosyltransferase [Chloroflexaceae bacterium]|nr:glycosyltransferase [Chloroflexaceae bacterium]NJO08094.1 glycosyltransferase [Chloroflexaceae bacterium]